MKWLDSKLAAIRLIAEKAARLDRRVVEADLAARRADRELAEAWIVIQPELKKRGIKPQEFCKQLGTGCSYPMMRRRVQLLNAWDLYIERRRRAVTEDRYGLMFAIELITDKDDNATDSRPREIDAKSSPASTPKAIASRTISQPREPNAQSTPPASARYIITRPQRWNELYAEWPNAVDLFPYPFSGTDAFSLPTWPPNVYMNFMFRKTDDPFGRSALTNVRHAIQRNKTEGTEIIIPFPGSDPINALVDAGAEVRSWGREPWLHAETGEYCPNPGAVSLFILRGHSR